MSKKIPLTRGFFAVVDAKDYPRLSKFSWQASVRKAEVYAVRAAPNHRGGSRTVFMHREIMGFPARKFVDHLNRNGLDNRRANLRIATRSQNGGNSEFKKKPLSGFRGVHQKAKSGWQAIICRQGINRHIGYFKSAELAFAAYKKAHIAHHGEFSIYSRNA